MEQIEIGLTMPAGDQARDVPGMWVPMSGTVLVWGEVKDGIRYARRTARRVKPLTDDIQVIVNTRRGRAWEVAADGTVTLVDAD